MNSWYVHLVAYTLLVVGGLNWGLVGLFNVNLVTMLFGGSSLEQLVYVLVGASALYEVLMHKGNCKACEMMMRKGKRR